jgi:hypothetical protein
MLEEWRVFRVRQKGPDDTQVFTLIGRVTSEAAAQAIMRLYVGDETIYAVGPEVMHIGLTMSVAYPVQRISLNLSLR